MSNMKKTASKPVVAKVRKFPPDRYDYHDDVTKDAVNKVRKKAAPQVKKADLELVDGLGPYSV